MRKTHREQLPLTPIPPCHARAQELAQISDVLDLLPEAAQWVLADVMGSGVSSNAGRNGMTAEQILRALLIRQMNQYSYEDLAFHLADSSTYRAFCRLGIGQPPPKKSALQKNIKRVKATTLEKINRALVLYARDQKIETGRKIRTDCTVVETHIHAPTDSSLLFDGVRVLARLMDQADEAFGLRFIDHSRRAKRRAMGILNAPTAEKRLPLYRDLLKVTNKTVAEADRVAAQLDKGQATEEASLLNAMVLAHQLRHYGGLCRRVIEQTDRRIVGGETVPAKDKIVSLFEPHTDIIIKDRRQTLYGHKVCLTAGSSGIILEVVVEEGNPADSTLPVKMMKRHSELFGRPPRQASFDGGFTSQANLEEIKQMGVEDVAFSKRRDIPVTDMAKSNWVYRALRNFRAGIEGVISFLKRSFGMDRCLWQGLPSFGAWVFSSVLACNLLVVARHLLAR